MNLNPITTGKSTDYESPSLVPAAFGIRDDYRIYGGVDMGVNCRSSPYVEYRAFERGSKSWQVSSNDHGTYSTYRSNNPNSVSQGYYRAHGNVIHHVTDHIGRNGQSGNVRVTWENGTKMTYSQQASGLYMPNK